MRTSGLTANCILASQILHRPEEEKTINQEFNLPVMSYQPITLGLSGPPPT